MGLPLFPRHINDLTNDLSSSAKLFADDTSLLSVVFTVDAFAKELNDDRDKVHDWELQYELSLRIQSACGKMRTRIIPNTDTFHAVPPLMFEVAATEISKVAKR